MLDFKFSKLEKFVTDVPQEVVASNGDKPAGAALIRSDPGVVMVVRQRRPTSRGFLLLLPLTAGSLQSRDVYSLAQSVLHVFISAVQPCSAPHAACLAIRRVSHHFRVPGSPNSSHSSEHGKKLFTFLSLNK